MRIRVSIVEDSRGTRESLTEVLSRAPGLTCVGAHANGEQALKAIPAEKPDVVLMDINLPGISGIEAMKILRDDPATAHIPIVALSANAMPRDVAKGLEAGFFSYLTKPIKVSDFTKALDAALQSAHAHA
jgi:CheY-like chemotaxis protein